MGFFLTFLKIYGPFVPILQNVGTKVKMVGSTNKYCVEKTGGIDHS
jgi:hypothetical protein